MSKKPKMDFAGATDWPVFYPTDILKMASRQAGASEEEIAWYDTASPEEIKECLDIMFEEVQKEINREVIRTIEDKVRVKDE